MLRQMSNLVTVKIDVSRLYCWFGCCRKERLSELMDDLECALGGKPNMFELHLQGLFTPKEEDLVLEFGFLSECKCKGQERRGSETTESMDWEQKMYLKHASEFVKWDV